MYSIFTVIFFPKPSLNKSSLHDHHSKSFQNPPPTIKRLAQVIYKGGPPAQQPPAAAGKLRGPLPTSGECKISFVVIVVHLFLIKIIIVIIIVIVVIILCR